MASYASRFLACKFKTFKPILQEFRQRRTNDLLGHFLPVIGIQPAAQFQTCSCLAEKRGNKTWQDLPQPELKPVEPKDYERWRRFLRHANKPQPNKMNSLMESQSEAIPKEIIQRIDQQIKTETTGRLFAVVQIAGKQFKITTEDIIVIQGTFVPTINDELQLEKVLLVGSSDFTLVGRPLLNKDLLKIEVSVIEKTMSHIMIHFKMKRRKQYRRTNFKRDIHTMLRIKSIQLREGINEIKDVDGLEDRIF